MRHISLGLGLFLWLIYAQPCLAWDGFDADSADLVEIIPDIVPLVGQQIEVRDYDTEKSENCVVKSITRNSRTIEVVVQDQEGKLRTLVMEGR